MRLGPAGEEKGTERKEGAKREERRRAREEE